MQLGVLSFKQTSVLESDADVLLPATKTYEALLFKLYLRLLKIPTSALATLQIFRNGHFKQANRQFDKPFENSNLTKVEKHPQAYFWLVWALF